MTVDHARGPATETAAGLPRHRLRPRSRCVQRPDRGPGTARGANASQSSRNLLLTPLAEINARPQLEIQVDDVQCRHGATIGTLDDEQLFYLLSRGLDPATARALLTFAFCHDLIGRVPLAPVRAAAEALVAAALPDRELIRGARLMAAVRESAVALDLERIRGEFPVLARRVNGHAARLPRQRGLARSSPARSSTPSPVYARAHHANVHRGVHTLSQEATALYEGAREKARRFVNATSIAEIIFVRGTTEAINLVAQSYGRARLAAGDEIVVSRLEHHSNIVPWQLRRRADRAVAPRRADRPARRRRLRRPTSDCSGRVRASSRSRTSPMPSAPCCRSTLHRRRA